MGKKKQKDNEWKYYQIITMEGLIDIKEDTEIKEEKERWSFNGAVYKNEKCILRDFDAITFAVSEAKARQNIIFRVKKKMNLPINTRGIHLKGDLIKIDKKT